MVTCTTKESITAQEIIRSLGRYYRILSQRQGIAFLKCVICRPDISQITYYTSGYSSNESDDAIENQTIIVDAEKFNEIVNGLSRAENLYLSVKGYKTNLKELCAAVFVEIPEAMIKRREDVARIISTLFSENGIHTQQDHQNE